MGTSLEDFENRGKRYTTAHVSRVGWAVLMLFAYSAFVRWIYEWLGIGKVWWGVLTFIAALLMGFASWLWYCFSHSPAALHRKYGLLCPNCDAWLVWMNSGKTKIVDGKCVKCGCPIIDAPTDGPLRLHHWPTTKRLVALVLVGLFLCTATIIMLIMWKYADPVGGVLGLALLWLLGILFCLSAKRVANQRMPRFDR